MTTMTTHAESQPDPTHRMPSLQILASELDEFKRTGRQLHLLHAVRALDEARVELREFVRLQVRPQAPATAEPENLHERQ